MTFSSFTLPKLSSLTFTSTSLSIRAFHQHLINQCHTTLTHLDISLCYIRVTREPFFLPPSLVELHCGDTGVLAGSPQLPNLRRLRVHGLQASRVFPMLTRLPALEILAVLCCIEDRTADALRRWMLRDGAEPGRIAESPKLRLIQLYGQLSIPNSDIVPGSLPLSPELYFGSLKWRGWKDSGDRKRDEVDQGDRRLLAGDA